MRGVCCVVAAAVCWAHGLAEAGVWQQRQGTSLVIQTQEYLRAEAEDRLFQQSVLRNYAEVPIGRYSIGYKAGYAFQQAEGEDYLNQASGFNEAELFVSRHTTFDRSAFALRGSWIIPTTKVARGQRQMGQDAAAEFGSSLGSSRGSLFAEGYLGYRRSFGMDADQFRADTVVGYHAGPLLLLAQTFTTRSLGGEEPGGLDFDLTQASVSAVMPVHGSLSLEIGGRADLAADGFDEGRSVFFSLWWRR
ncbi:hypothetical protein [Parvularcula maris]|uniref:Cellulose biosynthesis protein BcsS n=1 Tax=Parvularcula maris TaxID=2965077 RepID=A0A9X2RKN5_9PROT|nr:hypothetical protein [Parvularcula maris]MCQ8185777.1 hypothetical protein [Parvularcula maris]